MVTPPSKSHRKPSERDRRRKAIRDPDLAVFNAGSHPRIDGFGSAGRNSSAMERVIAALRARAWPSVIFQTTTFDLTSMPTDRDAIMACAMSGQLTCPLPRAAGARIVGYQANTTSLCACCDLKKLAP
jgi:hypothetical protein